MDTNQPATPGENTFGVNRRDFLRSAAVAGAGLMLVPTLLAQDQTSAIVLYFLLYSIFNKIYKTYL